MPTDWMYMPRAVFFSITAVTTTSTTATINGVGTGTPGNEEPRIL